MHIISHNEAMHSSFLLQVFNELKERQTSTRNPSAINQDVNFHDPACSGQHSFQIYPIIKIYSGSPLKYSNEHILPVVVVEKLLVSHSQPYLQSALSALGKGLTEHTVIRL